MDEIFSLIADRIASKIREAQRAAVQEQARQQGLRPPSTGRIPGAMPSPPVPRPAAGNSPSTRFSAQSGPAVTTQRRPPGVPPPLTPSTSTGPPAPSRSAVSALERQVAAFAISDPFPTRLDGVGTQAAKPASKSALLGAFAERSRLLAAIVLGEALAPPVALRPHEPRRW